MAGLNKIYYDLLIIWKWLTIFGPPCRARWSRLTTSPMHRKMIHVACLLGMRKQ